MKYILFVVFITIGCLLKAQPIEKTDKSKIRYEYMTIEAYALPDRKIGVVISCDSLKYKEYKSDTWMPSVNSYLIQFLNKYGEEGWLVVSSDNNTYYVLCRRKE